jgi:hypothetical protein
LKIQTCIGGWLLALALVLPPGWAPAQQEPPSENLPPEVLSSELTLKTLLETDRLDVTFVIVDSDNVTRVTIDGEPQTFEPADTVVIGKRFVFSRPVTLVRVSAEDERGNRKSVTFTVYGPGIDPEAVAAEAAQLQWFVTYDLRLERDTNPSNDLSSPIKIEGIDLTGVIPDDQQEDTRRTATITGGITKGPWNAFAGVSRLNYSKDAFADRFDVAANMVGGGYRTVGGGLELGYLFTDINLGEFDYAVTHTLTPGWRSSAEGAAGSTQSVYFLEVTSKDFANQEVQENTTVFALKWNKTTLDSAGQDTFRRLLALGNASEGIAASEFNYLALDLDWGWRWDAGFLWNIGFGWQYRDYANEEPLSKDTFLGDTRTDSPLRFSTGVGWYFLPEIQAVFNYRYVFNLSNKSPYVRQVYGIGAQGRF